MQSLSLERQVSDVPIQLWNAVKLVESGTCSTPEELAKELNLGVEEINKIIGNPEFLKLVANVSKTKLFMKFYGIGLNRLFLLIENEENPKHFLAAFSLAGKLIEQIKDGSSVNVNVNLESLVKQTDTLYSNRSFIDADAETS